MDSLRISATAHWINYLPEYLAAHSGAFERLDLQVVAQVCNPWTGVLDDLADGSADLALGGIWGPAMYAGMARNLITTGQLNGRFPMAVVTRMPVEGFDWTWMKEHTVLVPGAGGTAPYEFTAGLMREAGVDPAGTRFVRDLSSEMLTELFKCGLGDAIVTDLLSGTALAHEGVGTIACRLADVGGPMPNSVYYARRDCLGDLDDRLVRFLTGIREAMEQLTSGTFDQADLAEVLAAEWPQFDPAVLQDSAAELISNGTWSGIRVDPDACGRWVGMLRTAGLITRDLAYEDLVDNHAVDRAERAPLLA
jgi:NitT/TauT family transport system substrate-binding protein